MDTTDLIEVNDNSLQINNVKHSRLDDSLFSKDLAPHYMKLAGQLATSDLVPKSFRGKPQDLFLCWALGYQIGMSPEQAMQCIAIVNGKATMWGDEMLALCMSHREFEDIIENPIVKNDSVIGYTCIVKRKGKADKESIFTLEMAKKAGLLAKGGVWNQYPERMLKLRARGFCLRDAFPDALKGIKSREEVEDYIIDADCTVSSRTERLKQEIQNKGVSNHDRDNRPNIVVQDIHSVEPDSQKKEYQQEAKINVNPSELHSEIKKLIYQKMFTDDRLAKALAYYEAESIEELSVDSANNFIDKLNKL